MTFYTHILLSRKTGKYYYRQTQDLNQRLAKHNNGYVSSTKHGRPWVLKWNTEFSSRSEAVALERKLKNMKSRSRVDAFIDSQA